METHSQHDARLEVAVEMHEAARRQILKAEAYLLYIKRRLRANKLIGCVEGYDEEVVGGQGARNDLLGAVTNQPRLGRQL